MTRRQALIYARPRLEAANIAEAALESELLLRQALSIDRAELYSHPEARLSLEQQQTFNSLLERRLSGEPAAYIRGRREFYGLDFFVDDRVLIPRPESELLVEEALNLAHEYASPIIADIGTGSGAIAICLALKLPQARIYATDISGEALEVAAINCQRHNVADRITLLEGDLLEPLPQAPDIVVANLPYVPESQLEQLQGEPPLALDGGANGTDVIRRLCQQAKDRLKPGAYLLLEIGQGQGTEIIELLEGLFPSSVIEAKTDLASIPRVVILKVTPSR